ncbi:hypothetical protein HZA57_07520, partial [Candidatus Poribacteria bacterium]|nr:hypothetical protein [Candidatus Poribacteria bacterium]
EARAQHETGRTDRTLVGLVAKTGVKWRKLRLEAGARAEHDDVFNSERDRLHVFVQLSRILGNLGPEGEH